MNLNGGCSTTDKFVRVRVWVRVRVMVTGAKNEEKMFLGTMFWGRTTGTILTRHDEESPVKAPVGQEQGCSKRSL